MGNNKKEAAVKTQKKKKKKPKYIALDLSNVAKEKEYVKNHENECEAKKDDSVEHVKIEDTKYDSHDFYYEEIEYEDEADNKISNKKEKDQDYNIFVKTNQNRHHCTSKTSKRQR